MINDRVLRLISETAIDAKKNINYCALSSEEIVYFFLRDLIGSPCTSEREGLVEINALYQAEVISITISILK